MSVAKPLKGGVRNPKIRITIPCGKCHECLSAKRSDWSFRLGIEHKNSMSAYFVTLTYNEENYPEEGVVKEHIQNYVKKIRNYLERKEYEISVDERKWLNKTITDENGKEHKKYPFRYYIVAEFGSNTQRGHYHALLFNLPYSIAHASPNKEAKNWDTPLTKLWQYGQILIGTCTDASIHYTAKYMINNLIQPKGKNKPFTLQSKGIGKMYTEPARIYHKKKNSTKPYVVKAGFKQRMPRYYQEKYFNLLDKLKHTQERKQRIEEQEEEMLEIYTRRNENIYEQKLLNNIYMQNKFNLNNKKNESL